MMPFGLVSTQYFHGVMPLERPAIKEIAMIGMILKRCQH
jgi:hypothetical protein